MESTPGKYIVRANANASRPVDASDGEAKAKGDDGEPPDTFEGLLAMIEMLKHVTLEAHPGDPAGDDGSPPPRISPRMF